MEELLTRIKELSAKEKKTLEQMVLKLSEEVGETSQALLSYKGAPGSEYKKLGKADVEEECVDVMIVALSLFYKLNQDEGALEHYLKMKVVKWSSVMT
ncbi:MazG-like family protein [Alkalicoccobacillus plakortidis]|uniref:MazG-like family protein n=1 Tax=Alkalicoccobacillus plakortidis TaxID=444060 RepID=A0ABT0XM74_9BACI|nr:MazG-like family protein [Alkalicoccobacillus plakortidis]MCM2676317.1 MazG-like family protein [Alkalicoccobacillus plakortidis]